MTPETLPQAPVPVTALAVRESLAQLVFSPLPPYRDVRQIHNQLQCAVALLKAIETTDLEVRLEEVEARAQRLDPRPR